MKKELEKKDFQVEVHYDSFIWCHIAIKNNRKASFRIDTRYEKEKKMFKIDVLSVDRHRRMKKEIKRVINWIKNKVKKNYGEETKIKCHYTNPIKEAWFYPTYIDYLAIPFLLANFILYYTMLNFVPFGSYFSYAFVILSIPVGFAFSASHHWGAGAPYPGFDKMIKTIKLKYTVINFICSIIPYLIAYHMVK